MKSFINCNGRLLPLDKPLVMGILNVTPDSFVDGGLFNTVPQALSRTQAMLNEGAAIIDIGGQSTRPGAELVSAADELKRVIPIIESLVKEFPLIHISVDTFYADVAKAAVTSGAIMVNDISAGDADRQMIETVAQLKVPYIAMHRQGTPDTMQANPQYADVFLEVYDYLAAKVNFCHQAGIADVIIDPGFGFGKTVAHNYTLLRRLADFKFMGSPILMGVSRKSMINKVLGIKATEALNGTTVLNTLGLMHGASILRVHDVKAACEAVELMEAYHQHRDEFLQ
jgi:dihydropteroate synthase